MVNKSQIQKYENKINLLEEKLRGKEQTISILFNLLKDLVFWNRGKV